MGLLAVLRYPIEGYYEPKELERQYRENVRRYGRVPAQWNLTLQRQRILSAASTFSTAACVSAFGVVATPYWIVLAPATAFFGLLARDQFRYHRHARTMAHIAQAGGIPAPYDPTIRNGFFVPEPMPPAPSMAKPL